MEWYPVKMIRYLSMNIFLTKYSDFSIMLKYDLDTGDYTEVIKQECKDLTWEQFTGFYEKNQNMVIGLHRSKSDKLVVIYGNQRYVLETSNSLSELQKGEQENTFSFLYKFEKIFTIQYPRSIYWDEWSSTDEDMDFFTWLHNSIKGQNK